MRRTGAPALALAQLMPRMRSSAARSPITSCPRPPSRRMSRARSRRRNSVSCPSTRRRSCSGKGDVYRMLGTVTHGNLYVLASAARESLTASNIAELLKGSKIGCLQLNNFVGYALRIVSIDTASTMRSAKTKRKKIPRTRRISTKSRQPRSRPPRPTII